MLPIKAARRKPNLQNIKRTIPPQPVLQVIRPQVTRPQVTVVRNVLPQAKPANAPQRQPRRVNQHNGENETAVLLRQLRLRSGRRFKEMSLLRQKFRFGSLSNLRLFGTRQNISRRLPHVRLFRASSAQYSKTAKIKTAQIR